MQRQLDLCKFKDSLVYTVGSYLKQQEAKTFDFN